VIRTAITVLMSVVLGSACSSRQADVPRSLSGTVVDGATKAPISSVKVTIEIKNKGGEGLGPDGAYTPKVWGSESAETGPGGTFSFDLRTYTESPDRLHKYLTVSKISFDKDGYEPLVRLPIEDWSRTELKRKSSP
jgi:hypothetical protein